MRAASSGSGRSAAKGLIAAIKHRKNTQAVKPAHAQSEQSAGAFAPGRLNGLRVVLLRGRLGVPNGQGVRRTLAADTVVGQDFVRGGEHVRARKHQSLAIAAVELDGDEQIG